MKEFTCVITDEVGLHARPAGALSREAKKYKSTVSVVFGGKSVNALKMMAVMRMGVKTGDTVTITVDGEDEATAAPLLEQFCKDNL